MTKEFIGLLGGKGFLGTRLSQRFDSSSVNYLVYDLYDLNYKNYIKADIQDIKSLDQLKGVDAIINLAAIHRDDVYPRSRYDDVNVKGSVNICETARKYNINKIIFTSSVAIYGFAPPNTDESGKPNYFNDYGRTKYLAEQVYMDWHAEDPENRTLIIIRPTVIFGEGNRGNVYNLLKQIASRRFIMFGDGKNIKSMAYVENVAAFLEHSLSFKPGLHVYNYIDKPDLNVNNLVSNARNILFKKNNVGLRLPSCVGMAVGYLADFVTKLSGKKLPVSSIRVKKFMGTTQFTSSISETGFTPPVSLKEGLSRTIKYEFIEDNSNKQTFETE